MAIQSEQQLENNLISQLSDNWYIYNKLITDEQSLVANLKDKLEKLNNTTFTPSEFDRILNHLNRWSTFDRSQILRDKLALNREDSNWIQSSTDYIKFIDLDNSNNNIFEVVNQVSNEWVYKNRYDVTLLINWFPLVQIELKRRGIELKEAFNQFERYQRHSFNSSSWLFLFTQIFVISNWVDTKYYANNRKLSFDYTFFWTDTKNQLITNLTEFTDTFLKKSHLHKMLSNYIVLNNTERALMVLRPYQYYAVEAIISKVQNTNNVLATSDNSKNWFIWHTTWSWKTLTSFKTAQLLIKLSYLEKVVFVVDRKDLDYQTVREFNSFQEKSVDDTESTHTLVDQLLDPSKKLIVTTIQKLNKAISSEKYQSKLKELQDKRIVFIFDECHRSQFGETHTKIKRFFNWHQMIGFTWTPIFEENAQLRTTADLFWSCLHTYILPDAIRDKNVLQFQVEYYSPDVKELKWKKELYETDEWKQEVSTMLLSLHNKKTFNKEFNWIFCIDSIPSLVKYYHTLKEIQSTEEYKEKDKKLKIAAIFSYHINDDKTDWLFDEIELKWKVDTSSKEQLDEIISEYNQEFWTNYNLNDIWGFESYRMDIARKVRNREIDILLVVDMFLTWFDSKTLNTLYVDKNLKQHWLIQAFSRTNRILNKNKPHWNIVCFRDLRNAVDDAIKLYSNNDKNIANTVLLQPISAYISQFESTLSEMRTLTPTVDSVNTLLTDEDKKKFIVLFRDLLTLKNTLTTFIDFNFEESLSMKEQEFADFTSKYLDIYEYTRKEIEGDSILSEIDFSLELLKKDNINLDYIFKLLWKIVSSKTQEEKDNLRQSLLSVIQGNTDFFTKKELLDEFLDYIEELQKTDKDFNLDLLSEYYETFLNIKREKDLLILCSTNSLNYVKTKDFIEKIVYLNSVLDEKQNKFYFEIWELLEITPTFLEKTRKVSSITIQIKKFRNLYY